METIHFNCMLSLPATAAERLHPQPQNATAKINSAYYMKKYKWCPIILKEHKGTGATTSRFSVSCHVQSQETWSGTAPCCSWDKVLNNGRRRDLAEYHDLVSDVKCNRFIFLIQSNVWLKICHNHHIISWVMGDNSRCNSLTFDPLPPHFHQVFLKLKRKWDKFLQGVPEISCLRDVHINNSSINTIITVKVGKVFFSDLWRLCFDLWRLCFDPSPFVCQQDYTKTTERLFKKLSGRLGREREPF